MTPQDLVERALAVSRADGCIVIVEEASSANLRWAANTLTTNGVARTRGITVVAVVGESTGVLSRTVGDDVDVIDIVRAAETAAAEAVPSADAGPLVEAGADNGTDWDEVPVPTSIGAYERFAPALGDVFRRGADYGLYGYAEHEVVTTYLGISTGVRRRHVQPDARVEMTGRTADGSRSGWAGASARQVTDIDLGALVADVDRRLGWARRRVDLPAGRYPTVLPPSATADMAFWLYVLAFSAIDAHEGRSVLSRAGGGTRLGERLATLPISMMSDPYDARQAAPPFVIAGASSREFSVFDNGLPLGRTEWIRDGELTRLAATRHAAQVTGEPVAPYVENMLISGGAGGPDTEEMVAGLSRGLLLTCLWYIRVVDPQTLLVTGLTRDGVFLVEGGEVVGAVNNFRFNESPVDLLQRVTAVGPAEPTLPREAADYFPRMTCPPVLVPDFNMSTVSRAT